MKSSENCGWMLAFRHPGSSVVSNTLLARRD